MGLKEKLKNRQLTIGSWITLAHPSIAEIMADTGFEWLAIDMEHSVITIREAEELIRIIELKGKTPLVRVTANDSNQIKRVMDAGAKGVIIPMVKSADDVMAAVKAVKYPPLGSRSVGLARAQKYGMAFKEYASTINDESIIIAQIEHIEAIEHLEEILSIKEIDGTIIGPYDLSGSMGKPGRFDDQDVILKLKQYEEMSTKYKKPFGYHVVHPDYNAVSDKINSGYTFIALSVDFLYLVAKIKETVNFINNFLNH